VFLPEFLNFATFSRIHNIPDPGADHGMLGGSGRMSGRARKQLLTRRDYQFAEQRAGQLAYQYLIDCGAIIDPSQWRP
jgi:hypothetical protein